jgi:cysteine-rich repeat protein
LNHFGNAQLLKVLFQHAKRFVEMENLKVHIQKFVMMTMKLMVMDVRHLVKLKQTGNALDLKELQVHASLWYVEMRRIQSANSEACDDGNTTPGDGCSAIVAVEIGWTLSWSWTCYKYLWRDILYVEMGWYNTV